MKSSVEILFSKYLDGQCSPQETTELLQWFKLLQNEELLKQSILKELQKPYTTDDLPNDLDTRLSLISNRLSAHRRLNPGSKSLKLPGLWVRVAAAAALALITVGIWYYNQSVSSDDLKKEVIANAIKPGSNHAVLTLANGRKIELNDLNGQPVYVVQKDTLGTSPEYNTIAAPAGAQWQVVLTDGTHVWLNASSSITYPTVFSATERKVRVSGEVYFEVAHNKALPFRVEAATQHLEVLGTKFNLSAYPDEAETRTTLLEGSVKIDVEGQTKTLKPGEQGRVAAGKLQLSRNVDLEEVTAWKNGYFKFNGDIKEIMTKISRWYNVQVVYESTPDTVYTFEGEISRSRDLHEVLDIMQYTGKIHFDIKERRIIVKE